jgi:hypothetical protein
MEYIQIDEDGFVSVYVNKVNQAKLALEELTLKKKRTTVLQKADNRRNSPNRRVIQKLHSQTRLTEAGQHY